MLMQITHNTMQYSLCDTVSTNNVLHFFSVRIQKAEAACSNPSPFVTLRTKAVYHRHNLTFQLQHCTINIEQLIRSPERLQQIIQLLIRISQQLVTRLFSVAMYKVTFNSLRTKLILGFMYPCAFVIVNLYISEYYIIIIIIIIIILL